MLYMEIKEVTLLQLHREPGTAVPAWVGGKPGATEVLGDEVHVRRLIEWATMQAWSEHTTVEITGHLAPQSRGPFSPLMDEVHGSLKRPASSFEVAGWSLRLTQPGKAPRDVDLWFTGYVIDRGTAAQQKAERAEHAAQQKEYMLRERAKDGHGLIDQVLEATNERMYAQSALDAADEAWRTAITQAVEGGESPTQIARLAKISRERVYQIKDNRR